MVLALKLFESSLKGGLLFVYSRLLEVFGNLAQFPVFLWRPLVRFGRCQLVPASELCCGVRAIRRRREEILMCEDIVDGEIGKIRKPIHDGDRIVVTPKGR